MSAGFVTEFVCAAPAAVAGPVAPALTPPRPNYSNISDRPQPAAYGFTSPLANSVPSRPPSTYQGGFTDYTPPSPSAKKAQLFLKKNIERFIEQVGIDRVGIITLTFPKKVRSAKQAAKLFNNFNRRSMKTFKSWIRIFERHADGSWHIHLVVEMPFNIRAGFNVELYNARRDEFNQAKNAAEQYRIICQCTCEGHPLRQFWKEFRAQVRAYHLGRFDLLPVLTDAGRVANYYSKGIAKTLAENKKERQQVRLVGYSKNFLRYGPRLAWISPQSRNWRLKTGLFAKRFGCQDSDDFKALFGPRWGYYFNGLIALLALPPRDVPGMNYLLQFKPFLSRVLDNEPRHQGTDNRPATATGVSKANGGLISYDPDPYNEVIFRRLLIRYPELEQRFFATAAQAEIQPMPN